MPLHPDFPYGSLPGEIVGTYVHIPKKVWWLLRQDPGFLRNWKSSSIDRPYHIAVSCLTRGLSMDQVITVVRMWHQKHGHGFYEDDFLNWTYTAAADYAAPFVFRHEANKYWAEIRRIASDPNARQHSKLRVAYFLMNSERATAREISERTGISLKTVRNSILALLADGKVLMTEYGVYQAVKTFYWDRATLVGTLDDGYVFDDDHPAMYDWWKPLTKRTQGKPSPLRQTINAVERGDGCWLMKCYDYCQDQFATVVFDAGQRFPLALPSPGKNEWVVNADGEVVENSTGLRFVSSFAGFGQWDVVTHKNGNRLDFRKANLVVTGTEPRPASPDEDVDFFSLLRMKVTHEDPYIKGSLNSL